MYCEVYKATIPEKTCVLRQKAVAAGPQKRVRGGCGSLYHRFIGCRGCAVGLALYEKYKKGEFTLEDKIPEITEAKTANKRCSKCGQEKPLAEFHNKTGTHDNKDPWCKVCKSGQAKLYRREKAFRASLYKAEQRSDATEKMKQPSGDHVLFLDFSGYQELYNNIKEMATAEFRSPEMQVMYWLNKTMEMPAGA